MNFPGKRFLLLSADRLFNVRKALFSDSSSTIIKIGGWTGLSVDKRILDAISRKTDWKEPTEIQLQMIPAALQGRNIVASARAGTGKTAAYLIPTIQRLLSSSKSAAQSESTTVVSDGDISEDVTDDDKPRIIRPRGLIVVPSSMLADQIASEFRRLAHFTDLTVAVASRHQSLESQRKFLMKFKPDLLVCTPGRLQQYIREFEEILSTNPLEYEIQQQVKHANDGTPITNEFPKLLLDTRWIESLVLDEADRLLSLDHYPQLKIFFQHQFPTKNTGSVRDKQVMLVSATIIPEHKVLVDRLARKPRTTIELNSAMTIPANIEQILYSVDTERMKQDLLFHLLKNHQSFKDCGELYDRRQSVLIFARSPGRAKQVTKWLQDKGYSAKEIHSDQTAKQRHSAIKDFKSGKFKYLVSTDLLSRGIDIPEISHVINYDVPLDPVQYLHCAGRCGRQKRPGTAITLVAKKPTLMRAFQGTVKAQLDEMRLLENIENFLKRYDPSKESKRRLMPNFHPIPNQDQFELAIGSQHIESKNAGYADSDKRIPIDQLPHYEQVLREAREKNAARKHGINMRQIK